MSGILYLPPSHSDSSASTVTLGLLISENFSFLLLYLILRLFFRCEIYFFYPFLGGEFVFFIISFSAFPPFSFPNVIIIYYLLWFLLGRILPSNDSLMASSFFFHTDLSGPHRNLFFFSLFSMNSSAFWIAVVEFCLFKRGHLKTTFSIYFSELSWLHVTCHCEIMVRGESGVKVDMLFCGPKTKKKNLKTKNNKQMGMTPPKKRLWRVRKTTFVSSLPERLKIRNRINPLVKLVHLLSVNQIVKFDFIK